jgi:hypothetical protein
MRVILLFLLLLPLLGFSQSERLPYTLKIAPIELINPVKSSVNIHADIPISKHWGIDIGVGWAFASSPVAQYKQETYFGPKVNPSIKYYFRHDYDRVSYVGLMFKYGNIENIRYINVIRQGLQYTEWLLNRRRFIDYGVALRFGRQLYFGERERFIIEPFWGIGVRQLRVENDVLPPDANIVRTSRGIFFTSIDRSAGIYTMPDLMLGFYLGWKLK